MSWILCTSGAAIAKAGANANSTIIASGATLAMWSESAEAFCNMNARATLTLLYPGLTPYAREFLQDLSANLIAQKIITYDMSGYTSRAEAETMLDVLENNIARGFDLLKDDKFKLYLGVT